MAANTVPIFYLSPAKIEVDLKVDEQVVKSIKVSNTLGYDATFGLSVEDIGPNKNITEPAVLYGDADGPFTVRDLVTLPYRSVFIRNGETKIIPIAIKSPVVADGGGHYGVVLFSVASASDANAATQIVSRLGTTLLIKSAGVRHEAGRVVSFDVVGDNIRFYDQAELVVSQVTFQNTGNIYLNTYGLVVAKNVFGREVAVKELDPWYVLPGATRLRQVSLDQPLGFGWYRLEAKINRGYDDQIDRVSTSILVLPSPLISAAIVAVLVGLIVWFVVKKHHAKRYV